MILSAISLSGQNAALHFNTNGKFKIVQFTDIHYHPEKEGAEKSIRLMKQVLDAEKPDLVVFTGDIVTYNPQKTGWDDVLNTVIEYQIPYAVVLGNHDEEHNWTREQIINYITTKPYSYTQKGPDNIKGVCNYILELTGNKEKTSALLYFFDSNAYNQVNNQKGYDWFGFDQIDWYRKNSRSFTQTNRDTPFPAMAFFHIPLQEYTLLMDTTKKYVKNAPVFGTRAEKECPGIINTGMFAAMVSCGDIMGVFTGHEHDNDYIGCLNGICLAYGRFTGTSNSYNEIGSGARVIELIENQRRFETWIRDEQNQVVHKVVYPDSFLLKQ
jgi:hypothetical protein